MRFMDLLDRDDFMDFMDFMDRDLPLYVLAASFAVSGTDIPGCSFLYLAKWIIHALFAILSIGDVMSKEEKIYFKLI